jgi:hypothetical protein
MHEVGADSTQINRFIDSLRSGKTVHQALSPLVIPSTTKKFVLETMKIQHAKTHEVVACFLMGREDVIPDMFRHFLQTIEQPQQEKYRMLRIYLQRHIDLDEDSHAPMGRELMKRLCGFDHTKWAEAIAITRRSLRARQMLWDGVVQEIRGRKTRERQIMSTHTAA